ncbi:MULTISPECIES: tol-pal system protein YbgF [Legionella]|uniref:tol-pal system protein YbgF n=1 Tax=Legionella TaxID=445 RepID=UPI000F8C5EE3|nr:MULTISPECIES: tol-pal system protein YbgF [Legionella]MCP0914616.1 tol-pal system protein YbgF [Legionella sp. 27cVA30]RUQ96162.1 tol-pal system protein YbgF [Legionella septentrionalis]RUR09360.1 tol-pal system protein YbgF [Legionella septentrionalis]
MIKSRFLLAACLSCFLIPSFAAAPVIDDSENFMLLEEQQDAYEQPVARAPVEIYDNDDEPALAYDTAEPHNRNDNSMLLAKIQGLQQEIQELRGQLEIQTHDLKLLQQQQLTFYKDLDERIRNAAAQQAQKAPAQLSAKELSEKQPSPHLSTPTAQAPKAPTANAPAIVKSQPANAASHHNPADEQISYLAAYELVKNKKYDDALTAMQNFVNQYPQGGYTANAQYWLGELYMVKKNYSQAISHFEAVLQQFPSSSKSAASLLKIGYALAASGKKTEAKQRLQEVIKNYPDTNTAQLATAKLETLGS